MAVVGKWIDGISAEQSLGETARLVLTARLDTVWHWLRLAAEESAEDIEYVHQLRVSSRRAVAAVRAFGRLLSGGAYDQAREELRQIRKAADRARDLDVLHVRFSKSTEHVGDDVVAKILQRITEQRCKAQTPIRRIYEEMVKADFGSRRAQLIDLLQPGNWPEHFGGSAPECLRPAAKKFFKAAKDDLSNPRQLHRFRIAGKKLRYTMEIVAAAYDARFLQELYPEIESLQDYLGSINDHASAHLYYRDWRFDSDDAEERAFVVGLIVAELTAISDLQTSFFRWWTDRRAARFNRKLRKYIERPIEV